MKIDFEIQIEKSVATMHKRYLGITLVHKYALCVYTGLHCITLYQTSITDQLFRVIGLELSMERQYLFNCQFVHNCS